MVVGADLTMLVVVPDAVVAEPMVAVPGILVEPVELGIFAGVVAAMLADAEHLFVMAVPMGPGAAAAQVLEVDPKLVAFAADVAAHLSAPSLAEPVDETVVALAAGSSMVGLGSGPVLALEAESRMMAEFEGSKYLWEFEAVLESEKVVVSCTAAVVGTDYEALPGTALELDAKNCEMAEVVLGYLLESS